MSSSDTGSSKQAPRSYSQPAHHAILDYLRRLRNGAEADPAFEQRSLSYDLGFNSLNLAELVYSLTLELDIPPQRVIAWEWTGIPGPPRPLADLFERVTILAQAGFDEIDRDELLDSGVVGDRQEIFWLIPDFDMVGFVIRYATAIESLAHLSGHDASDIEYVDLEEDPDWD
jgi:hypothetical protein